MKPKLIAIVAAVLLVGCSTFKIVHQKQMPEEVSQMDKDVATRMERYVDLFNNEQADAIAEEIYLAPVQMRKFGDEIHSVATTAKEVGEQFNLMFKKIKSKGWKRSVIHHMDIKIGGQDMAFVDMRFSRLMANGEPIPPAQRIASYVLVKRKSGWRIISALGQSNPEAN
jgi:hypothetical protein